MKEILIAFAIALVVGSIWNDMNGEDSQPGNMMPQDGGSGQVMDGNGGNSASQDSLPLTNPQAEAGKQLVIDVDEGSFQGYVLDAREPVLVEFYTDNCPHCQTMAPVLGQLAFNGQGVVRVCKINAEKARALADRYNVGDVPGFVLFNEGHMVDSTAGARSLEQIRAWLAQNSISVPAMVAH